MNWSLWRGLRRVPGLLAAPRTEPTQHADRIIAIQRNIILPAKVVIVSLVFYYIYFSRGMDPTVFYYIYFSRSIDSSMVTAYSRFYELVRFSFGPYLIINLAAAVTLLVGRRFPPPVAQGIVLAVGFVDGVFLGGLTLLTGGFNSVLYWVFAGVIVVNAVCIPLATPQLVLNLLLTFCYLAAGAIELRARDTSEPPTYVAGTTNQNQDGPLKESEFKDLLPEIQLFRSRSNELIQALWGRLSDETRQKLIGYPTNGVSDDDLRRVLVKELNAILARPRQATVVAESADPPVRTRGIVQQLSVLWLLTFCCYGVQLLSARQRLAIEEQREFVARTGQLRAAGRLAAEIAHKLKNPLGIINNAAFSLQRALRDRRPISPQQLTIIQEEVERSDRIITQIMGYSQLAEGRVEKLDVAGELRRAIDQVFPAAAGYAIEVKRRIPTELPALWMQPSHFNELFVNILQNAREALNGVGKVAVTARLLDPPGVEVVVEDNGPGIPVDKLERVFEPYFSMREKGTGLGLSLVRHNAELYGGTVRAESELGRGARFVVVLPARSSLEAGS